MALSPLLDDRFVDGLLVLRAAGHDLAVVELTAPIGSTRAGGTEISAVARRLWWAEREMIRDRLAGWGIAVVSRSPTDPTGADHPPVDPWDRVLLRLGEARRNMRTMAGR